jgi:prefoldin subunit 5
MIAKRLEILREEYAKGQQQLAMLDQKRAEVRDTLLRITGAIQVLEELTAADQTAIREIDRGQDRSVA